MVHESAASRVDIIDRIGQVPERPTDPVGFRIPVPGELDLRVVVAGRSEENQRVTPRFVLVPTQFSKAQGVAIERERLREIGDTHHGVQVLHARVPAVVVGGCPC